MSNKKSPKNHNKGAWAGSISPEDIDGHYAYMLEKEHLETLHTRELLILLRGWAGREHSEFHSVLKEVLATREHIPTVKEAKALRKQKQLAKQNR